MKITLLFGCIVFFLQSSDVDTTITIIKPSTFAQLSCAVVLLDLMPCDKEFIETIVHDLQFTNQFLISVNKNPKESVSVLMKHYKDQRVPFVLFLKENESQIDWWLYDTMSMAKIDAKRYYKKGAESYQWAHNIADMIWILLTGNQGFFSTKIAYCKESFVKRGISLKVLCIADYNGLHEEVLVDEKTVLFGPRWHYIDGKPMIFYSEETMTNTRLLSVTMDKKINLVSNNPGITMLVDFNGKKSVAVYSASDKDGYSQIVMLTSSGLKNLTSYSANSLAPVITTDGKKIYFYSDYLNKLPQICVYDVQTGLITALTHSGYNVGPAYCACNGKVAYTKMHNHYMQVFVYDPMTNTHRQLTTDSTDKEDCSWSPAGDYLLVSVKKNQSHRIALLNSITGQYTFVTDGASRCSDSHWSGCINFINNF